jgi:hypothetical protein
MKTPKSSNGKSKTHDVTTAEIVKRLATLEKTVEDLAAKINRDSTTLPWWEAQAGRFANDPIFEEAVRLGREYRESLRPRRRKVKRDRS